MPRCLRLSASDKPADAAADDRDVHSRSVFSRTVYSRNVHSGSLRRNPIDLVFGVTLVRPLRRRQRSRIGAETLRMNSRRGLAGGAGSCKSGLRPSAPERPAFNGRDQMPAGAGQPSGYTSPPNSSGAS